MSEDNKNSLSVRQTFVREIERQILSEELKPGDRLPTSRELRVLRLRHRAVRRCPAWSSGQALCRHPRRKRRLRDREDPSGGHHGESAGTGAHHDPHRLRAESKAHRRTETAFRTAVFRKIRKTPREGFLVHGQRYLARVFHGRRTEMCDLPKSGAGQGGSGIRGTLRCGPRDRVTTGSESRRPAPPLQGRAGKEPGKE